MKRIWVIVAGEDDTTLYAGGDPGVLFESHDNGVTWDLNIALWEAPSRPQWRRDSGGLSVHSIVPWPGDPRRLALAISAAGVWLTEDGGETWRQRQSRHRRRLPLRGGAGTFGCAVRARAGARAEAA